MFRRTLCLQEFGLELRVLSSDLKKEREEVIKGGRKGRAGRERERKNQSHTTHHLASKDRVSAPFH